MEENTLYDKKVTEYKKYFQERISKGIPDDDEKYGDSLPLRYSLGYGWK